MKQRQETKVEKELLDNDEMTAAEEAALLEMESESDSEEEELEKGYYEESEMAAMSMHAGPTSFEELEQARGSEKKARMIEDLSYDTRSLVRNIINSPMLQGTEKANAIKKVGDDFGSRVQGIMDTPAKMLKENDPEVLELEALLAQDEREQSWFEKNIASLFQKDKAKIRNDLEEVIKQLKSGDEESKKNARMALPKIRAAAKKMGIGTEMENGKSGLIIQKDAQGDWRWVGWPSNNFKDRSEDILIEKAHVEYVDWWNKEKPNFPVFTSMHAPGTAREHPVDFVGYENGFLVMSGKLTEAEAAGLLRVQKSYDLGMSHTGWGVRSLHDPRQIVMYRLYEVTDLPLEMADNPFTDLSVISKEADMQKEEQVNYLAELLGSKEKAEEALSMKTSMKQKELQEAGVEQKEAAENEKETKTAAESPATPDMQKIFEAVSKEMDLEGLSEGFASIQKELEKIPMLEDVIKQQQETIQKITGEQDEKLAEKIAPPAAGKFAWSMQKRASQSKETKVEGEELEELKKKAPGIPEGDDYWLSKATNSAPVTADA